MDTQQAQQLIKDTFETAFSKAQFSQFIRNLLNDIEDDTFSYQGSYIPEKFRHDIKTLERIGKYSDGDKTLDILIVTLQKETSLERARTMQRNFIAWYLDGSRGGKTKDAALVAYVSPEQVDWRFSLVKMDYEFKKTKTGIKAKKEITPARRWSFLVGPNENSHTAQSQLVKILADDENAPALAQLEEAFNIEPVTKEFFIKYRELFIRTKEALDKVEVQNSKVKDDFAKKGVDTVNFAKKLLGQIVFLYFLQKKGWFGVGRDDSWGTGSKKFLRELFSGVHGSYGNFFDGILEPLFYEALRIDRNHDDDYYSRFNCKIPFLNGGLFDPIGNYDWVHTDINLPNELFSNDKKTKEGDKGDGILDVFDRYNFTVREDEPLEKEVAIDPELLGKAYEKFNAIRPDNFGEFTKALKSGNTGEENKFNKKFGVYYTPREIVHYMCKQSLINYLSTRAEEHQLAIDKQAIEDLIEVGEMIAEHEATALIKEQKIKDGIQQSSDYTALLPDSIRQNAPAIDDWLADITVCDPAVGSGAFPVGMMNEIVRARGVLSVFLSPTDKNVCAMLNSSYEFKRRCIEHTLYGVDIDPGAVEIAKLRLWLSLVVDEEDIKNIKPLPNLDYRIMQGNSLISEFMGINLDDKQENNSPMFENELDNLVKDFQTKKEAFLNESNVSNKTQLKDKIEQLLLAIFEAKLKQQKGDFFSQLEDIKKIYSIEPNKQKREALIQQKKEKLYKKFNFDLEQAEKQLKEFTSGRQVKPFFLWNLYFSEIFHQKGGFDVVIGNPPYISALEAKKIIDKEERDKYKNNFMSARGAYDLYILFFELGISTIKNKGNLIFISPSKYLAAQYAVALREHLSKYSLIELVDLSQIKAFESASVSTLVTTIKKDKILSPIQTLKPTAINDIGIGTRIINDRRYLDLLPEKLWGFLLSNHIDLIKKIWEQSTPMSQIAQVGASSTASEADEYSGYISQNKTSNSKKIINTKTIDHIFNHWGRISYKNKDKMIQKPFLETANISQRRVAMYQQKKLIFSKIARSITASYDMNGEFSSTNTNFVYAPKTVSLAFLAGYVNSSLANFLYKQLFGGLNMYSSYQFQAPQLRNLPVPKLIKYENEIESIVNKIFELGNTDDYLQNPQKQNKVKDLEREIDQMVYQLYNLTEEEIRIVEER